MPPVPRPSAALAALVVVAAVLSVAVGSAAARTEGGGDASAQSVTVHAQRRSAWRLPPRPAAVGVEYLNHELYGGGLGAQLVFGESFEEPDAATSATRDAASNPGLVYFPGYLGVGGDIGKVTGTPDELQARCAADDSCCGVTYNGPRNETKPVPGFLKWVCQPVANPDWSTFLKPPPPQPAQLGYIGCFRGRAGATHELTAGVSEMWLGVADGGASPHFSVVSDKDAFNGLQYQRIEYRVGGDQAGLKGGRVGVANHGLNCQHGLHIERLKDYEGSVYLRANVTADVRVSLEALDGGRWVPLALPQHIEGVTADWRRFDFKFRTILSSRCPGAPFMTPKGENVTLAGCTGRFVISLHTPGAALDVDFAQLFPGMWALLPAPHAGSLGLQARADVAHMLQAQGLGWIRMGGSMCNHGPYRWKDFRGPREQRQPYHGDWYRQPGNVQSRGFGMFEIVDTCTALGCTPVVTVNSGEKPEDMADFVEYCWGDETTTWGKLRHEDGHPLPYNVTHVEIGNEVPITPWEKIGRPLMWQAGNISAAMDERSRSLGLPLFTYAIGHNLYDQEVMSNVTSLNVEEFVSHLAPLGDRVYWDVHTWDGDSNPEAFAPWERLMVDFRAMLQKLGSKMRVMVLEENGADHGLLRAMSHATFHSGFTRQGDIVRVHGYANGLEAWQGMDVEQSFPQGQLMTLPNASWAEPTYHVIEMVSDSFQPVVLASDFSWNISEGAQMDAVAVASEDGATVTVRVTNWGDPTKLVVELDGVDPPPASVKVTQLTGVSKTPFEENTPGEPDRIVPRAHVVPYDADATYPLPQLSFTVLEFKRGQR